MSELFGIPFDPTLRYHPLLQDGASAYSIFAYIHVFRKTLPSSDRESLL